MESRFLPSKKILSLLAACVFTVLIIFGATRSQEILAYFGQFKSTGEQKSPKDSYTAPTANVATISNVLQAAAGADQDNDDLKDWEESLWKTDPTKADTDADGTPDGEEARLGRDPLKPQKRSTTGAITQDDTLASNSGLNKAMVKPIPEENLSETDKFGRELFTLYMNAKKSGAVDQNQIIQELVNSQSQNTATKQYRETDFVVIPAAQTTETTLREYGNALGRTLANHPSQGAVNEFEVVTQAVKGNAPAQLQKLDPIIAGYQKTLAAFLAISVPRSMVPAHLELLNSVHAVLLDIQGFKKTFSDPIVGLMSLNKYPTNVERLKNAFINMRTTFEREGIVFEQSEYGYIVVHAI